MGREPNESLPEEAKNLLDSLRSETPHIELTEEERDALLSRPRLSPHTVTELLSLEDLDVRHGE